MRILTVTGLFPSAAAPTRGVFIRERMKAVARLGAEVRVIAPVPHTPPGPLGDRYATFRDTPDEEVIDGMRVVHPRYLTLPKIGMYFQDRSYARGIRSAVANAVSEFQPDLIDAHYLYPDGCAAARVAADHGIPFAVSARGSDVKLLGTIAHTRKKMHAMLGRAALVISVSADLRDNIHRLIGWPGEVAVIPNGIDPAQFHARPREEACEELGIPSDQRRVVCVGHLVEEHRQELLVRGLADGAAPSELHAYLVGGGPEHNRIAELARTLGVEERVHLVGPEVHERIPLWFSASDASALLSEREGCPNVVLESLACGTPCLLTDAPEMHEVIASEDEAVFTKLEPASVARGLASILARGTRVSRPARTWDDVAREVIARFESVVPAAAV